MKEKNNNFEQNQPEIKNASENSLKSSSGPDFKRLIIGVCICLALLIIAKLLGI